MKVEKKHTNFGQINNTTTRMSLDSLLCALYPDEVVEYAELLKGQYYDPEDPDKFSDEFFLEMAARLLGLKQLKMMVIDKIIPDACPDPKYAQYSYEEIINMAQNGVNIPDEVLEWAYAQQEADPFDYIILTDEIEIDDNSDTSEITNESDITKLRKLAKQYIAKSTKYQDMLEQDNLDMDDLTRQVNNIVEDQKQNADSIDNLNIIVSKWKSLDKKNKNGELSESEREVYKNLSEEISANKKVLEEIETNKDDLDEFLKSMKDLRIESDEALIVAQETLDVSSNLSKIEKELNPFMHKQVKTFVNNVDLSNLKLLSEINDESITYVADRAGRELQVTGNNIITDLTGSTKIELKDFAFDYSARARELVMFVNNNFDEEGNLKQSQEDTNEENEPKSLAASVNEMFELNKSEDLSEYGFKLPFVAMPKVASIATAATLTSSSALMAEIFVLKEDTKNLNKQVKDTEKEKVELEEKGNKILEQYNNNKNQININNEELESINRKIKAGENPDDLLKQAEEIITEQENLKLENEKLKEEIEIPVISTNDLVIKNKVDIAQLKSKSDSLGDPISELNTLSKNTLESGIANLTCGEYNALRSVHFIAKGTELLSSINPITVALGLFFIELGLKWSITSAEQLLAGPYAITGSAIGFSSVSSANDQIKSINFTEKYAQKTNNETETVIQKITNSIEGLDIPAGGEGDLADDIPIEEGEEDLVDDPSEEDENENDDEDNNDITTDAKDLNIFDFPEEDDQLPFVPISRALQNSNLSMILPKGATVQSRNSLSIFENENTNLSNINSQDIPNFDSKAARILQVLDIAAAATSYMANSGEFYPNRENKKLSRFKKDLIIESKRKSRIVTGITSTADRQGNYY